MDEQYMTIGRITECARLDCEKQSTLVTLDTQHYEEPRLVWSCEDNHIFTTNLRGDDKQN